MYIYMSISRISRIWVASCISLELTAGLSAVGCRRLARQHMPHQLHQSLTCTAVDTSGRSCYGGEFA